MVEIEWEQYFEYHHRIISEKIVRALDTGQLMGDALKLINLCLQMPHLLKYSWSVAD